MWARRRPQPRGGGAQRPRAAGGPASVPTGPTARRQCSRARCPRPRPGIRSAARRRAGSCGRVVPTGSRQPGALRPHTAIRSSQNLLRKASFPAAMRRMRSGGQRARLPPTGCGPCRPCRGRRGTSPPRSWSPIWGGCELSAPGRSSGTGKDVGVPGRSGSPSRNHWGDPSDRGQGRRPGLPGRARPAAPAPDTPAPHPGAVRGHGVRSPRLPVKARPTPSRLPDVPLLDSVAPRREAGCTGGFSLRVSPARVGRGVTHASRAEASVRHTGTWREGRVRGTARAGTLARAPPARRLRPAGEPGAPRWPDTA